MQLFVSYTLIKQGGNDKISQINNLNFYLKILKNST